MNFANSEYLIYIVSAAAFLVVLGIFYAIYRYYVLKSYFARLVSLSKFRLRYVFAVVSLIMITALFGVVLLRPQWGFHMKEQHNRSVDLLIALDLSRSMDSADVDPTRLARSKRAIKYLVESVPGRVGLIVFAGDAFLQCPLTTDKAAFMMYLDYVDSTTIATQGTDVGKALLEADRVFEKKRINKKILLLISDGEDHQGGVDSALAQLKEHDVSVFTAGVGITDGELVPVTDGEDASVYLKDRSGELVKSKLNRSMLKKIASTGDGSYTDISTNFSGIRSTIEYLNEQSFTDGSSRYVKEPDDRFHYFAFVLILLLIGDLLFQVQWRRK